MQKHPTSRKQGFTLVELLTVIAIIGILAAILIPTIGGAMNQADRLSALQNGRGIAAAYNSYTRDKRRAINSSDATTIPEFALILAKGEYLTTAELFFSPGDPLLPEQLPSVAAIKEENQWQVFEDFENVGAYSFDIVVGNRTTSDSVNTPLLWTRGLETSGVWNLANGVYEDNGGHIIFLDQHGDFYDNLTGDEAGAERLVDYDSKKPTANILETISPGALVIGKGAGTLAGSVGQ